MPTKTSTQREAQLLADFLALKSSEDAAKFRIRHPRFAPASWWDYRATDSAGKPNDQMQWQMAQALVQEAWDEEFELSLFQLTRLLLCVFDPNDTVAGIYGGPLPAFAELSALADNWGFHIGVRYLTEHQGLAKICKDCKRPFAADIHQRKYCFVTGSDGLHCSERVIKRGHLDWWHTRGDQQRKSKQKRAVKKNVSR